jgi:flagella basal body P-ring formation protein FlgA
VAGALAAAGVAQADPAAALPAEAAERALALARGAAGAVAPPQARIVVTAGALDARLRLAPCARIEPWLVGGQPAWGRTRVGMRCQAGAAWNVFLPVQVQVFAPALVSRTALPAGARLAEEQLELAEADWAAASSPPVRDAAALAGRILARPIAAGQAPRLADLQPRQWFSAGAPVRVLAHGPGYAIRAEGTALAAGLEGQVVRVRTDQGRILTGRAVGNHAVEVAL